MVPPLIKILLAKKKYGILAHFRVHVCRGTPALKWDNQQSPKTCGTYMLINHLTGTANLILDPLTCEAKAKL